MNSQPVKGTHDLIGLEAAKARMIEEVFRGMAELYGFKEARLPILEYTEVFARGTGESSDIVRKEMYTFLDKGERSVTMRPEFTAGLMRAIVSNKLYATEDLPLKLYYVGPAFRYERPQLGRYRQFNQFGIEAVGLDKAEADAEAILLALQAFAMLGFERLHLKVNTLGDAESRAAYRDALRAFFSERIDDMCADCHERLRLNPMRILDCKVEADQEIAKGAPRIKDYLSAASESRFYKTLSILNDFGVEYEIDENLVRGLDYYSEIVFEVHATSKDGTDYGALCGGGHYSGLIEQFGGPDLPGVGFAIGVERIAALMEKEGLFDELEDRLDVYVMPIGEEALEDAFAITTQIRCLGYSAETPFAAQKLGTLFKKATRRNARFALIVGEEELARGVAQLKNLATAEQKEIQLASLEEELDAVLGEEEEHHCHCGEGECHCHEEE